MTSWDVAGAQVRQAPKTAAAPSLLPAPRAGTRLWGLHPRGAEPFPRPGDANVPLPAASGRLPACVPQQRGRRCPAPSVIPAPAKSGSRSPGCGYHPLCWLEESPLFSAAGRMMGRGDEGLRYSMESVKLGCSGLILEAWQGTGGGGTSWCSHLKASGFKWRVQTGPALGAAPTPWQSAWHPAGTHGSRGMGGPVPLAVPKQRGSGTAQRAVLLLCQPCSAHLLEPPWLSACGCLFQKRWWHF